MDHLIASKTVVGAGDGSILLEVRGRSVRIKRRGHPDVYVPIENAAEVGRFLLAAATPSRLVRA